MKIELELTTKEYATMMGCLVWGCFEPQIDTGIVEDIIIKINKNAEVKSWKNLISDAKQ